MTTTSCPRSTRPRARPACIWAVETTSGSNTTVTIRTRATCLSPRDEMVLEHERVHVSSQEAGDGLLRSHDDRLVLIERGIEHDRDARKRVEGPKQRPVAR